ncbi:phosphoribosylamine--glycine ligase [Suttonella ornithocola]
MKILIIGSGGREHAIAWKLAQDHRIGRIYVAPGNGGTAALERSENVPLTTIDQLIAFAKEKSIDLTIVGSEALLVEGIVDQFKAERLRIFGPDKAAAMLEGSKSYAKTFMQKYGVKTAAYQSFTELDAALQYLKICPYPTVVKASGLAAGKGVIICHTHEEAETAVYEIMQEKCFGCAGDEIVIEEFLEGFEVSILSFCDGHTILPMQTAKDHKAIGDGNTGENTGGMGVVAPHPFLTKAQYQAFIEDILNPTLKGIQAENLQFAGIIFFGLMVNKNDVYLLEYNMRMGDPETQAILPLLETDFLTPIFACLDEKLDTIELKWADKHSICVVAASKGYPGNYQKGFPVHHLEQAKFFAQVFIAGATYKDHQYFTNGGRVLNVVALGDTLEAARHNAYSGIQAIQFEGMTYRHDIGIAP